MAKKASRHLGHGLLKAVRDVSKPEKHRRREPNPWPRCPTCFHRVPELCPICTKCTPCCPQHDDDEEDR